MVAAKSLAGHMPLWIGSLCCLTFGPVKLLSWKKNARYRSFAWFENSDLQSINFRLFKVPFQQHFSLEMHVGARAGDHGWWYRFQMHQDLAVSWAEPRRLELLGAVSCVQRTPFSGFATLGQNCSCQAAAVLGAGSTSARP